MLEESVARMNTRSLLCGAPASEARTLVHFASYPILASSARTMSSPFLTSAETFSTNAYLGRSILIALANSYQSPLLFPSLIPSCLPATLMSWQGKPPTIISTGSTSSHLTFVISPRLGTLKRSLRMMLGKSSFSHTHLRFVVTPASCKPFSIPP